MCLCNFDLFEQVDYNIFVKLLSMVQIKNSTEVFASWYCFLFDLFRQVDYNTLVKYCQAFGYRSLRSAKRLCQKTALLTFGMGFSLKRTSGIRPAGRQYHKNTAKRDIRIRGSRTVGISGPEGDVSECYKKALFVRGGKTYRPIIV